MELITMKEEELWDGQNKNFEEVNFPEYSCIKTIINEDAVSSI